MCGLAGILASDANVLPERATLDRMLRELRHRGPDGSGIHIAAGIGLAHSRLSIIDLDTGKQPICNEDETVWVIANGEVFNYVELRQSLRARGHKFSTQSDSEVIVHLYEEYGDRFVDHMNGQFAFALWDSRRRRLLLVRDRAGIRPLFYARSPAGFVFASEVKALFATGALKAHLDPRSLWQTFMYWAPLEGRTPFDGISAVPPGSMLIVEKGAERLVRYWDWDFSAAEATPTQSTATYAEELRGLLEDAVRLQMRSDVPVATYLSGGLDSSIVTSLARGCSTKTLQSFSVSFEDAEYDESTYQRLVAHALGVNGASVSCSRASIAAHFPDAIAHIEAPVLRTAPVPLMQLAASTRAAGYKVVLTGEGADEVFAGYDIFREAKLRRWVARHPTSRWRGRLYGRLYSYLASSPSRHRSFAEQFYAAGAAHANRPSFAQIPRWRSLERIRQFFSDDVRTAIAGAEPMTELEATLPDSVATWGPLAQDQYVEAHTLMTGYLLSAQGDRVAMAHGVEARFPYLDHRVIEFACRLPAQLKLFGLKEKFILKEAAKGWLPAEIVRRPKQPYRAPGSRSFFEGGNAVDYVAELLSPGRIRDAGYFKPEPVNRLFEKCRADRVIGFGDDAVFLGILSTMILHDTFVRRRVPARAA